MPIGRGCASRARPPMPSATPISPSARSKAPAAVPRWPIPGRSFARPGARRAPCCSRAAAKEWHVPVAELTVEKSIVYHAASKRQATFGSLVKTAAALPVPEKVTLKDPKDFKLIGHQAAARRRGREIRRHGAIHPRCRDAGHAGGAAQAPTAVRRDRQILRCHCGRRPCRAWSRWCRCRAALP